MGDYIGYIGLGGSKLLEGDSIGGDQRVIQGDTRGGTHAMEPSRLQPAVA